MKLRLGTGTSCWHCRGNSEILQHVGSQCVGKNVDQSMWCLDMGSSNEAASMIRVTRTTSRCRRALISGSCRCNNLASREFQDVSLWNGKIETRPELRFRLSGTEAEKISFPEPNYATAEAISRKVSCFGSVMQAKKNRVLISVTEQLRKLKHRPIFFSLHS